MRVHTSVAFISLLVTSVAVGLHQLEARSLSSQSVVAFCRSLTQAQSIHYFCHRGSGRVDDRHRLPQMAQA